MAAKPPIVANWKLCGKWPSENPCAASSSSAWGPVSPGCSTAIPETASRSTSASRRRRSSASTASNPSRNGSTPPTTLVPPPNGTTATRFVVHHCRSARTSSCEPGSTTASGASWVSVLLRRNRSGVDLPPACRSRVASSVRTNSSPTRPAKLSRWVARSPLGLRVIVGFVWGRGGFGLYAEGGAQQRQDLRGQFLAELAETPCVPLHGRRRGCRVFGKSGPCDASHTLQCYIRCPSVTSLPTRFSTLPARACSSSGCGGPRSPRSRVGRG